MTVAKIIIHAITKPCERICSNFNTKIHFMDLNKCDISFNQYKDFHSVGEVSKHAISVDINTKYNRYYFSAALPSDVR